MKILIIGGRGYIGSHLSSFLKSKDIEVEVLGNQKAEDYNLLLASYVQQFQYIILLAGHSSVKMCDGPLKAPWNNNVRNFDSLIQKTTKNQKIIYASSSSVYGNKGGKVFNEEDFSLEFVNNYDLTKMSLDLLAKNYINAGRKIIGLRFGTLNGGSTVIRRDLMINSMIYSTFKDGVINVNNKSVSRPILALNDLSRAMYEIVTNKFKPGIYNLASFSSTVEEISTKVALKTQVDIVDKGYYPGIYDFITDTSKFKHEYKFEFKETVDSIIDDVLDCYTNRKPKIVSRDKYFNYER
jgi:nucleoside-diphosphate-sugar epimerase